MGVKDRTNPDKKNYDLVLLVTLTPQAKLKVTSVDVTSNIKC